MDFLSATEVRKNWSTTLDKVIREKPAYIKRTRDEITMMDVRVLSYLLAIYKYDAKKYVENDGSITLSLNYIDLVVNAMDENSAIDKMVLEIKEYAEEYYDDFQEYSVSPNRRNHVPYVLKALISDNESIRKDIVVNA